MKLNIKAQNGRNSKNEMGIYLQSSYIITLLGGHCVFSFYLRARVLLSRRLHWVLVMVGWERLKSDGRWVFSMLLANDMLVGGIGSLAKFKLSTSRCRHLNTYILA